MNGKESKTNIINKFANNNITINFSIIRKLEFYNWRNSFIIGDCTRNILEICKVEFLELL